MNHNFERFSLLIVLHNSTQIALNEHLYPFFSIIADKTLYVLRASLLLSSSNYVSADTAYDEGSFGFSLKVEFTSHSYVHIILATNTKAAASRFEQLLQYSQNILKLLAFKCFLNDVLLETECSKVMLIW